MGRGGGPEVRLPEFNGPAVYDWTTNAVGGLAVDVGNLL